MTHSFLLFVIYALCVFRVTRFFVSDTLTDGFREWLRKKSHTEYVRRDLKTGQTVEQKVDIKRHSPYSWAWKLTTCPWCVSIWVAIPIVIIGYFNGAWFSYVCIVPAFSAVAGVLAERS